MDLVDQVFANFAELILAINPNSLFFEFLSSGVIAGVGAFLVFVPQLAILFFLMGLLEDSGYLARASTLIDKPLSKIGMNGRSFVPILTSFACAIPGMMAARTIPNKKERLITLFILPLLTCSARIPVFALLLSFLFAGKPSWLAGVVMALIYLSSLLMGGIVASVINRFIPQPADSFFILELPSYRRPVIRKLLKIVVDKTISFIRRAGSVILILSLVIWVGTTFPHYNEPDAAKRFNESYATDLGRAIEPVFKPLGVDWRVGIGMISSFAAREVFVSTMAVVLNASGENEDLQNQSLLEKMRQARFINEDGSLGGYIFTPASIVALIIFFMIALQCMATVGVARLEFGSWKLALVQLFLFNILAYILAVVAYQIIA